MPNLARYLVLGAFIAALAAVIVIHVGNMRARQRRANDELTARRLASLGEYLDAGARRGVFMPALTGPAFGFNATVGAVVLIVACLFLTTLWYLDVSDNRGGK